MADTAADTVDAAPAPAPSPSAAPAPAAQPAAPLASWFDTAQAHKDGVSDADIAAYLSPRVNFDLDAAHKDGVDDTAIVNYLAPSVKKAAPVALPPETSTSFMGAAGRGAERGAIPAAAGMAGFGAGAEAGAALGAFGGPAAPITVPVGGLIGGLIGAYVAATSAGKAQEAGLNALPDAAKAWLGQSDEQRAADIKEHPYAAEIGEMAPQLALMGPGAAAKDIPEASSGLQRLLSSQWTARASGAALYGGQEAAQEEIQGQPIDPASIAIASGAGALMSKMTPLGERLAGAGASPVRAVTDRLGLSPVANTPEDTAADVMAAPTVDDAIAKADEVVKSTPLDIGAIAAQAQEFGSVQDQQQAKLLKLFGGLNSGTVEKADDGSYQFNTGADGQTPIPLKLWDGKTAAPGENAITPELAAAQRDHYEKQGVDVVYFENDPAIPFDGAVDPKQPNTIFLSNDPTRNAAQIGAHEITHVLESTTLPDGSSLGDLLHQQVMQGITSEGWRYANAMFGSEAPNRATFPTGPEGDSAHADAVVTHLVREMGADIGSEAPRFQTFAPKVIDAVQARYGIDAAKDVLQKFMAGLRQAMDTMRTFFGKEGPTVSQNWVTNLNEIHDTLAQMYAAKFGNALQREQAAIKVMGNQTVRERAAVAQPSETPPAAETVTARTQNPYENPRQPQRLIDFLRQEGGLRDTGGDVKSLVDRRPGLFNKNGMFPDDAAVKAWEAGYFPDYGENRPTINDLFDRIGDDAHDRPVYSAQDSGLVADYEATMARNAEVDHYADQYGIDTRGMSKADFWNEVGNRLSEDERNTEIEGQGAAFEAATARAEQISKEYLASRGDAWEPDQVYDRGEPRTREDMENEYRQEAANSGPSGRAEGGAEYGPAATGEGALPEGGGPRGRGTGTVATDSAAERELADAVGPTFSPKADRAEPINSKEYKAALRAHNIATDDYRIALGDYRAHRIDDAEFLVAKTQYNEATTAFDAAHAKEEAKEPPLPLGIKEAPPLRQGELLSPKVTPEIKAKLGPDYARKESPAERQPRTISTVRPIEGTGEERERAINQAPYRVGEEAPQIAAAEKLLAENPERAIAIAMRQRPSPEGVHPEFVFMAVEAKATRDGDTALIAKLADSRIAVEATAMGQRIGAWKNRDPLSAVAQVQSVKDARVAAVKADTGDVGKAQAAAVKQVAREVKQAIKTTVAATRSRQDWATFIKHITCAGE